MAKLQLLSNDNGWGLTKDLHMISGILSTNGFKVDFKQWNSGRNPKRNEYDANIHIELVGGLHFRAARKNILIPNPEWFLPMWVNSKGRFNRVLVKTNHAVHIFKHIGFKNVHNTGFTTQDIFNDKIIRKHEFLHIAGNSRFKGTLNIIKAWNKHPEWPRIYIYNTFQDLSSIVEGKNIKYHYGRVNDLREIQNKCFYHLQPSSSEGYGHILWEAMSVGAVTITTDALPMNEIENTIKIPAKRDRAYNLAWLYEYSVKDLEDTINEILKMDSASLLALSKNARQEYLLRDAAFRTNFLKEVRDAVK